MPSNSGVFEEHHDPQSRDEEVTEWDLSGEPKQKKKRELTIPLIRENVWRFSDDSIIPGRATASRMQSMTTVTTTTTTTSIGSGDGPEVSRTVTLSTSTAETGDTVTGASDDIATGGGISSAVWGLQVPKKRKKAVEDPVPKIVNTNNGSDQDVSKDQETPAIPMTEEEEAAAAIIKEARQDNERIRPRLHTLPLISQNVVPGLSEIEDVTERYRYDVSLRPDEPTLADFERVPVEEFGEALLRGMGWEKGKPVGKNATGLVEPVISKPRPHLLGLGATPSAPEAKEKKYIRPGEKRASKPSSPASVRNGDMPRSQRGRSRSPEERFNKRDRQGPLSVSDYVTITAGSKEGLEGVIVEINERSSGKVAKVKLSSSDEIARVWLEDLRRLASKSHSVAGTRRDTDGRLARSRSGTASPASRSWLRPRVRVRIVSKSLQQGRLYNQKATIHDVVTLGVCTLKTDMGEVIENVLDRHLETIVPVVGKDVMVVASENDRSIVGQVGRVTERNGADGRVVVEMNESLEYLVRSSYSRPFFLVLIAKYFSRVSSLTTSRSM
ncbi:DExH-box splicing factor binding site-domain-containing protein [Phlyctochytrium arcticum]|nr:DExH-box splicing factor binding site-domain-containing protein [Phlyctochytrium arcticum]